MNTANLNPALDLHFKALGFKDRAALVMLSADSEVFEAKGLCAKPDWLIFDKRTRELFVLEYKTRELGKKDPTKYECYQVAATMMVVNRAMRARGFQFSAISGHLVYSDVFRVQVKPSLRDYQSLVDALPVVTEEYRKAGLLRPNRPLAVTKLVHRMFAPKANLMSDAQRSVLRRRGTVAHDTIATLARGAVPA